MELTGKLPVLPAGQGVWVVAVLCGLAGVVCGWLLAQVAKRLAARPVWPRTRSALLFGSLFALHASLRAAPVPPGAGRPVAPAALLTLELAVVAILVLAALVDLAARIVPNELVLALLGAGVVRAVIDPANAVDRLLGLLVVGVIMLIAGLAGRGALGLGDVKLLAAGGLHLGWQAGIVAFLATFAYAAAAGLLLIALRLRRRRDMIPFAPFISAGIWTAMLVGGGALNLIWPFVAS